MKNPFHTVTYNNIMANFWFHEDERLKKEVQLDLDRNPWKAEGITDKRKSFYLQKDCYGDEWIMERIEAKEKYQIDLMTNKIRI